MDSFSYVLYNGGVHAGHGNGSGGYDHDAGMAYGIYRSGIDNTHAAYGSTQDMASGGRDLRQGVDGIFHTGLMLDTYGSDAFLHIIF